MLPIGPYSICRKVGNLLFISGHIAIDDLDKPMADQAHAVMKNIGHVLEENGLSFSNLVKTTIYLTDISKFAEINEIYGSYLTEPYPTRATLEAKALPKGAQIEIESIAAFEI